MTMFLNSRKYLRQIMKWYFFFVNFEESSQIFELTGSDTWEQTPVAKWVKVNPRAVGIWKIYMTDFSNKKRLVSRLFADKFHHPNFPKKKMTIFVMENR